MAYRGTGLSTPSTRQDIVSALLSDYGNSFGRDDASPSAYSPISALKVLPPPPPPRLDSIRNKPLPAVQQMSMKFQLRVDEETPLSASGIRKDSIEQRPRKKIVSRSLSRDSKPPSLKLTLSNGSTATIPPTPGFSLPQRSLPSSESFDDKELPPPPPAKSERRKSVKQVSMGLQQSKTAKELARNDSLLSQGEPEVSVNAPPEILDVTPIIKRKALPDPAAKKFRSLAELGTGPRGGKGGPMPLISAQRKGSIDSDATLKAPRKASVDSEASNEDKKNVSQATETVDVQAQRQEAPKLNALPPTPDEEKDVVAPAPPQKVFTGLPSNPRAREPASPLRMRGKSSTGHNILKAQRPAPPIPMMNMNTITPEMTPSPTSGKGEIRGDTEISPVSPLPPPTSQRRPFSFEAVSTTRGNIIPQPAKSATSIPAPYAPLPQPPTQHPLRTTSLDTPTPSLNTRQSTAPTPAPAQSPVQALASSAAGHPPPFTPLTRHPIPLALTLIPPITPAHLTCYTAHKTAIWSNNTFQPMGCMVCHDNGRERKWACTWCQLRICRDCSEELRGVSGRDVGVLVRRREGKEKERVVDGGEELEGMPGIVVQDVDVQEEE